MTEHICHAARAYHEPSNPVSFSMKAELPTAAENRTHQDNEILANSDYEYDVRDSRGGVFAREKRPRKDKLSHSPRRRQLPSTGQPPTANVHTVSI